MECLYKTNRVQTSHKTPKDVKDCKKRIEGIEPSSSAWKADNLPLVHIRSITLFEIESLSRGREKRFDIFSFLL